MGTIEAGVIVDRALKKLNDEAEDRFDRLELLDSLNVAESAIVILRPSAYTKTVVVTLIAGTKQTIPSDGYTFLKPRRNMGVGGATPGRVITPITFDELDNIDKDWHTATENAVVRHTLFDPDDPRTYYVYPKQPGTPAQIEIVHGATPPAILDLDDPINLDDIYENALFYYVMFEAHSKDTTAARTSKAAAYMSLFRAQLGIDPKGEAE